MTMDEPRVVAFWMTDDPIADDDPLAAVKHRARAHDQAADVLAEAGRSAEVTVRADVIGQVASMFADESFDPGETWDAAEASGMPPGAIDSAGNVALALSEIEQLRWD
jgi:hypothetical protein